MCGPVCRDIRGRAALGSLQEQWSHFFLWNVQCVMDDVYRPFTKIYRYSQD